MVTRKKRENGAFNDYHYLPYQLFYRVIDKESRNLPKYYLPIIDVIKVKGNRKNESNK